MELTCGVDEALVIESEPLRLAAGGRDFVVGCGVNAADVALLVLETFEVLRATSRGIEEARKVEECGPGVTLLASPLRVVVVSEDGARGVETLVKRGCLLKLVHVLRAVSGLVILVPDQVETDKEASV